MYVVDGERILLTVARVVKVSVHIASGLVLLAHPTTVAAATGAAAAGNLERLGVVVEILRRIGKYVGIGSLMFSGIMWMGGHRTEATERAVGTAIGYLLVNHAADIIGFLESI